jgi:hypothetical protein
MSLFRMLSTVERSVCSGKCGVDLSILGVAKGGVHSIEDDVSSTSPLTLSDPSVAMYILGESVQVASGVTGYARFTTSPSTATWGVGNTSPTSNCATTPTNTTGALFSN